MKAYKNSGWLLLQDVADYTAFSESLRKQGKSGTEKLTLVLNRFFEEQEKLIEKNGGFIFKLAGDAYFAALPPLGKNHINELSENLIASETLKEFGLSSRIIAVSGIFKLSIIATSESIDVFPVGDNVFTLMRLEDVTEKNSIVINTDSNFPQYGEKFEKPEELKRIKVPDIIVNYRPEIVAFLRISSHNYETIVDISSFILKHIPYAFFSKAVPYKNGAMFVLFYGYPKATGKEKELAILSGFKIQEYLEKKHINYGIGISYDFVYTGVVGGRHFQELTFIGDGINIAARLAAQAQRNILLTQEISESVQEKYDFEYRGKIKLKGKTSQIPIVEFLGEKAKKITKLFVDREKEKNKLRNALIKKQKLIIRGEAGIGKTRLLYEALSYLNKAKYIVIQGFPNQPPLHAVKTIIKNLPDNIIAKFPPLRNIAEDTLRPDATVENTTTVLSLFLYQAIMEKGIWGLVVDNLHWVDSVSYSIIMEIATKESIGFIATLRSEYPLDIKAQDFNIMSLSTLPVEYTGKFIKSLVGNPVSGELLSYLYERSLGVPFLIEQFVTYLQDKNLTRVENGQTTLCKNASLEIPIDAFSLILARYDLLPDSEKRAIAVASCIGGEFTSMDVQAVLGKSVKLTLKESLKSGFIKEIEDKKYTFAHLLLKETVYAGLLGKKRMYTHRVIAKVFVKQGYDPYLIALHYEMGKAYRKSDFYWKKTFTKLIDMGFHKKAKEILDHIKNISVRETLHAKLLFHYGKYDEVEKIILKLLKQSRRKRRLNLLLFLASVYDFWGDYPRMKKVLKTIEKYEGYMDEEDIYEYKNSWGIYYDMSGQADRALQIYKNALKFARTAQQIASSYYNVGWIYFSKHDYKHAKKYFENSLKVAQGDRMMEAWPLLRIGQIEFSRGNMHNARVYLEESFSKFYDSGYWFGMSVSLNPLLSIFIATDNHEALVRLYNKVKSSILRPQVHTFLGFYFALKYFQDNKTAKEILGLLNKNEKKEAEIIELSLEGKLNRAYEKCAEQGFRFKWCSNIRPFIEKNAETTSDEAFILLKALWGSTTKEEIGTLKTVSRYHAYLPVNAILLKKIKNKKSESH